MNSILFVQSKINIELKKHLSIFNLLIGNNRHYEYKNNIFIGFKSTNIETHTKNDNFLAYDGQIYNHKQFDFFDKNKIPIIESIKDLNVFKQFIGMWAFVWTDFNTVLYGSDPKSERTLYRYSDDDVFILCSEPAPILKYIKPELDKSMLEGYFNIRNYSITSKTIWKGIEIIEPGIIYRDKIKIFENSIFDWVKLCDNMSINEVEEEFEYIFKDTVKLISDNSTAISFSGGVDSCIILDALTDVENIYTANSIGKDRISNLAHLFLNDKELPKLEIINIDELQWADAFNKTISYSMMPVLDHAMVTAWIVAKQCQSESIVIGTAADALFGNIELHNLQNNIDDFKLWNKCLDVYNGEKDQAILLLEVINQSIGIDVRSSELVYRSHGIESKSVFLQKPIMQFALGLPIKYKIKKSLLKKLFLKRWNPNLLFDKQGFAGHCNDSLPYLDLKIKKLTGDRYKDWKIINISNFLKISNQTSLNLLDLL